MFLSMNYNFLFLECKILNSVKRCSQLCLKVSYTNYLPQFFNAIFLGNLKTLKNTNNFITGNIP